VIPDLVELRLDVRTLPGQSEEDVRAMLHDALGPDLIPDVEIDAPGFNPASASPVETPLWDVLQRVTGALDPGARMVPFMVVGATDARFFRRIGSVAYGYQLLSERIPFGEFMSMFHADNERVDQESLRLTTELWQATAEEFLGNDPR
jgi:acetylornithine deacetylase/succinyl-diaminopimelate desuccinylase-like protein